MKTGGASVLQQEACAGSLAAKRESSLSQVYLPAGSLISPSMPVTALSASKLGLSRSVSSPVPLASVAKGFSWRTLISLALSPRSVWVARRAHPAAASAQAIASVSLKMDEAFMLFSSKSWVFEEQTFQVRCRGMDARKLAESRDD